MVTAAGLAAARAIAAAVPDPELPMVTVADLGILRGVATEGERLVVTITPTYSGCPALREIAHDLWHRLAASGFAEVDVRTALAPAWTSDWITAEGRRKLAAAGRDLPSARVLTAAELGSAFGRERIVHVAVAGGPLCRGLLADLLRLAGLRAAATVDYGIDFAPAGPASQDGGTEAHD